MDRSLGGLTFYGQAVMRTLFPSPLVDFLSVNLDVPWRIDSDTNLSASYAETVTVTFEPMVMVSPTWRVRM